MTQLLFLNNRLGAIRKKMYVYYVGGHTFITHHHCDVILSHLRSCRLIIVTVPLAEVTRVTTLTFATYIITSAMKRQPPLSFSPPPHNILIGAADICTISLQPLSTLTHCSDCAAMEQVECSYTGKLQGTCCQGF